jgi:hypothetical protein
MRLRLTKAFRIASALDEVADKLEFESFSDALTVDRLSDWIERQAFNPAGWLPGRSPRTPSYPSYKRPQSSHESYHSVVCSECGYTKRASVSYGQCPQCGGRMVLDVRSARFASALMKNVMQAKKTKMPVVFLGGECKDNTWRVKLKEEFGKDLFFLDPYDEDWEAEDNIYDELAGLLVADHVVFFRGANGTDREKRFLKLIPEEKTYNEFTDIEELRTFLGGLKGSTC